MNSEAAANRAIELLSLQGYVAADAWPIDAPVNITDLGISEEGGLLIWREQPILIDAGCVSDALADIGVTYFSLIDSTNTRMVARGQTESIANQLYLAELQYGGRGRRGRRWLSPFARNIAMTLGCQSHCQLNELGGLSLVIGLSLADGLEELGVRRVGLKWPNDVWVDSRKLCGILVELVQREGRVEYVVGIGINVALEVKDQREIDQPVTDLRECGITISRTEVIIKLIANVRRYLDHFEASGFKPFVDAFNRLHVLHNKQCAVTEGDQRVAGIVVGIGEQGELCLDTDDGPRTFHGGEASLRLS